MPRSAAEQQEPCTVAGKIIEDHGDEMVVELPSLRGTVRQFVPRKFITKQGEGK